MPQRRRRIRAVALLVALALLALPAAATSDSMIAIHGSDSGSTLTLHVRNDSLVVIGNLGAGSQAGCRLVTKTTGIRAVCPLVGVGGIEINMGPSGDFVEVADPTPVPITAHLGAGSDKFVGNAEVDNCFPEGARRNRCVGGPGNDICITGNRNSDCVGGAGNDYCHTGAGSDGCWGGPGRDICVMGPNQDGCHGGPGNDRLYGGPGADQLYGGPGLDYCDGGPGTGKSHNCEAGPRH
jgi:Ca2+-binding RTX toxin-like protein